MTTTETAAVPEGLDELLGRFVNDLGATPRRAMWCSAIGSGSTAPSQRRAR
jgi:hypothetical protein